PSSCASRNPSTARPSTVSPTSLQAARKSRTNLRELTFGPALRPPGADLLSWDGLGRPHVLGPYPKPEKAGGDAAQPRHPIEEFGCQRRRGLLRRAQRACNDAVLNKNLNGLRHPRGPLAALLDGAEIMRSHGM